MAAKFKTLKEYFDLEDQKGKIFTIPNYQRGYKWAVKEKNKESAVERLLHGLISAYDRKEESYFLQGVTVNEKNNNIILVDGQQRTTTLYLLLWCINKEYIKNITLHYDIREKSKNFIFSLKENDSISENKEDNQDIHYFKKAIGQIKLILNNEIQEVENFCDYILNNVKILYLNIDEDKATKVFTMINGRKATMLPEELIKAEMLRNISNNNDPDPNDISKVSEEWEINALRSRYAREWDKWLYWWNREDVQDFFKIKSPMGLLLEHYYKRQIENNSKIDFDNFKQLIGNAKKTKDCFKGLRDLQKSFEDIFDSPKIFNYLGLALKREKGETEAIDYFIEEYKDVEKLEKYAKWSLVDATHLEITEESKKLKEKAECALQALSGEFAYQDPIAYELAAKQLLRLNIEEDNKLFDGNGRKFDFSIYDKKRSLEHIHPKSKVYHKENENGNDIYKDCVKDEIIPYEKISGWLNRDSMEDCTEHSIGNLLLLHKDENSKFSNKLFEEKKAIYFNLKEEFKSRNLLHTISVFANSTWDEKKIKDNQNIFIDRFKDDYDIKDGEINNG